MDMLKLAGLGVCGALLAMLLRRMRPGAGLAVSLAAGLMLLAGLMPALEEAIGRISTIAQAGGLSDAYMTQLLKVGGVSLLTDFAAQTCRDAEENGLALKVEVAGRVTLIALSLPFMEALLTQIMSLSP